MRNRATTSLAKPKIRQSWSKYNLYNITRLRQPYTVSKTFFQQKWEAKSIARGYHGEQVRERQWQHMFNRRLRGVISMDPAYLAKQDGSTQAAGRGSGKVAGATGDGRRRKESVPFQQMTFAPLERRLDVAIHRALFASSARQARQFVIHGSVKVNGKKMIYPGYLLNPGDMFQVDPERVMYATGAPKDRSARQAARKLKAAKKAAKEQADAEAAEAEATAEAEAEAAKAAEEEAAKKAEEPVDNKETLKNLMAEAKKILTSGNSLPAKRKQDFRAFQKSVKRVLSRSSSSTILTDSLEAQFLELQNALHTDRERRKAEEKKDKQKPDESTASVPKETTTIPAPTIKEEDLLSESRILRILQKNAQDPSKSISNDDGSLSKLEVSILKQALTTLKTNPIDHTKPYATPWRPREYMSAFAFLPRYLEVNPRICAAVYLRHPVARAGLAEVPSPIHTATANLAYTWYLRRR